MIHVKRIFAALLVAFLVVAQVSTIPDVAVMGGSNLTTVGAVPYVSSVGVLSSDGSFLRSATGRYTLYDPTATTGAATLTVRAGAGQSSTSALDIRSSANASIFAITAANNNRVIHNNGTYYTYSSPLELATNSLFALSWNSGTSPETAADLGIKRSSANNLAVTNGSSTEYATIGSNGIILNNGRFQIPTSTPASAAASGVAGTIAWDANFLYVATGTNTWKRVAIATW